jgi:ABC-2 type transport system ATP-binding protein
MSDEIAIKVHDLHKSFDLPENKSTSIKQLFVNIGKKNIKKRQKVLDGIDFEIKKGDFFGIIGRNGSGKSTLLKLIAGVYTPDSGAIEVHGNLTPFIELGVGFNPELSGRDNVYLSASLLGFTRKQVDAIYDEIVEFAELQDAMDKKLKNYSSGMQVRLAFAIAVKAKNDILVFDEVLAVGDEAFQQKCINVFEEYKRNKQTVVFVTHDMSAVKHFCDRAILINEGELVKSGSVNEVVDHYHKLNS